MKKQIKKAQIYHIFFNDIQTWIEYHKCNGRDALVTWFVLGNSLVGSISRVVIRDYTNSYGKYLNKSNDSCRNGMSLFRIVCDKDYTID